MRDLIGTARQGGKRCAHQHSGGQKAGGRDDSAEQESFQAVSSPGGVDAGRERHQAQHQDRENADAQLDCGVHAQGITILGNETRQQQAAETRSSHEGGQDHGERYGRGANHQFQELKPDDLVDERRYAAAEGEEKHEREQAF